MVARAHLAPKLGLPARHVPLEAPQRDGARPPDGDDARVLVEHVLLSLTPPRLPIPAGPLPHVDPVPPPALEKERDRLAAHEEQPALGVVRRRLEQVQVVQLAQALVHAPAQPAHGDDVWGRGAAVRLCWGGRRCAHPLDRLGKVCRVLVWVVNDFGRPGSRGEVLPGLVCERV